MAVSTISFQDGNLSMEELLDQSEINANEIRPGSIITGKIVGFRPDNDKPEMAIVSMGTKSEGKISIKEFVQRPAIGEEVEAIVRRMDKDTGLIDLSKRELEKKRGWEVVKEAFSKGLPIDGVVRRSMEKGFLVNVHGLNMFLPHSHVGNLREGHRSNRKLEILGKEMTFKILEINQRRMTGVISRREFIEEQNLKNWEKFSAEVEIGEVAQGRVLGYMELGVLIEVGGIRGFLHKDNVSWDRNSNNKFKSQFALDQELEVRILDIDVHNRRLSLGLKQLTDDPWLSVDEKFEVNQVVKGVVTFVAQYGAFVEIAEGIEALLHVSEMSWTRRINRAGDVVKKGQEIETMIIGIDSQEKRIALGLKQLMENPWDNIEQEFRVGDVLRGEAKDVTSFGIFVSLNSEIDVLIRKEDVNWDEPAPDPTKLYKRRDSIDFKIIEINIEDQKIGGSIRHLLENPYKALKAKYPRGSVIDGVVSGLVDFGIFVKIDDKFEGLVHTSAMSREQGENPKKAFTKGQPIKVVVRSIDPDNRKISLSVRDVKHAVEKAEMQQYISQDSHKTETSNPFLKLRSMGKSNDSDD